MGVRGSLLKKILSRYMDANMKMSESLEIDAFDEIEATITRPTNIVKCIELCTKTKQ